MSWAARRRFIIMLIVGAVVVAFLVTVLIATFSKTPTCTDGVQNQSEAGIDCGGPCSYLCTALVQPPTVLFTKVISNSVGRTDIIASVENKNSAAATKDIPYRVQIRRIDGSLVREVFGTLDLPPGATIPVFIPDIVSGKQTIASAFLDIVPPSPKWFAMTADQHIVPFVSNTKQVGTSGAPRIEATLVNRSVITLTNVQVVVLVRNGQGDVIAASRTIVPIIPAQGSSTATFTWNNAFSDVPATIEVVPIIPLP